MNVATRTLGAVLLLCSALVGVQKTEAQPSAKMWRVGELGLTGSDPMAQRWWSEFRRAFHDLGYVEQRNVIFERRFADGRQERLADLATELVRAGVDVIVVASTEGALAAKRATTTIPIVAVTPGDAVATGLVPSLARPGGNVTGMSFLATDLTAKQLGILKDALPAVTRVAILSNPDNGSHAPRLRAAESAARTLKVQLQVLPVRTLDNVEQAFDAMVDRRAGALLILADPLFTSAFGRLAELAAKHRLPAISGLREYVDVGGLLSYGVSFADLFRRAAVYADKILKGARPADLPVEQPTRFEMVVNRRTARALGLTLPPSLLLRADQTID